MGFSANGIMEGTFGVIKLGGTTVVNVGAWSFNKTKDTKEIKVLGASNSVKIGSVISGAGQFTFYLDPADTGHQAIVALGTGDMELYYDGEATGDHYLDVAGASFVGISDLGADAADPGKASTVNFETGTAGAVPSVVT